MSNDKLFLLAVLLGAVLMLAQGCGFAEKCFEAVGALGDDGARATRAIKNHMYADEAPEGFTYNK